MKIQILLLSALSLVVRAEGVDAAVKHFYVDLEAVSIRGSLDGDGVDRCRKALTASYNAAIIAAREKLQAWRDAPERDTEEFGNMKMPFTEGAIFTGAYEGGNYVKIESIDEAGDRAYAQVRIQLVLPEATTDWVDLVVLHRVDDEWLIDDILSGSGDNGGYSLRSVLKIPDDNPTKEQNKAEMATPRKPSD